MIPRYSGGDTIVLEIINWFPRLGKPELTLVIKGVLYTSIYCLYVATKTTRKVAA